MPQANATCYRFCATHGQWVIPINEVHTTYNGQTYTQWRCPLHDAANCTPSDRHYNSRVPQVHITLLDAGA